MNADAMTVLGSPVAHTPTQTRLVAVVPLGRGTSISAELWPFGITALEKNRGRERGRKGGRERGREGGEGM